MSGARFSSSCPPSAFSRARLVWDAGSSESSFSEINTIAADAAGRKKTRGEERAAEKGDLAVILGGFVGPDLLHRLDLLAHFLSAGLVNGAVIFHVLGIPATADAEQEAALRHLVERGNQLCRLDCVALDYQADNSAEFEPLGDGGCGTQRDERTHHIERWVNRRGTGMCECCAKLSQA